MKWMLEHLFWVDYHVGKKSRTHDGAVSFARGSLELTVGFYVTALAILVANVTGWLIMDEIAKFWPELHPTGKGLRATDGFAIITLIILMIWSKRVYATPERVQRILQRFGELPESQLKKEMAISLWVYVSGVVLAIMLAVARFFPKIYFFIGLHLLLVAYTNWRIYLRWYQDNP